MSLTNAGRDEIAKCLVGAGTIFNNANAKLCVGDSAAVYDVTQTDLQGTTSVFRKDMETGYPIVEANKVTFKATYGGTEANFAWNEWGVANASSGGTLLNRVVEYNGTKLSGQTWIFEVSLTVLIGA